MVDIIQLRVIKASVFPITATNCFEKYVNQKTELTRQNFTISNSRQIPYHSFGFNFTYKFGWIEFKKEIDMEDINLTNLLGYENDIMFHNSTFVISNLMVIKF